MSLAETLSTSPPAEGDANQVSTITTISIKQNEASGILGLHESRNELLSRVQNLKKEIQEWRGKLDTQVTSYRQELGELRNTLNTEVEELRTEFDKLQTTLKAQLDATSNLAALGPSANEVVTSPSKSDNPLEVLPNDLE